MLTCRHSCGKDFWAWTYHLPRAIYHEIASKKNTKCNASRCYMLKSHNLFFAGSKYLLCVYSKEASRKNFFSKFVIWKKKTPYQSLNLRNIIWDMPYTFKCSPYHFSIFFKFTIPKEHFCDGCSFSFSFLLLKMSLKCSINVQSASKDKTLICTIWWYKVDIDKYIKNGFYTKIFSLIWLFLEFLEIKKNLQCNCEWVHLSKVAGFSLTTLLKEELLCRFLFSFLTTSVKQLLHRRYLSGIITWNYKILLINMEISYVLFYCYLFIIG